MGSRACILGVKKALLRGSVSELNWGACGTLSSPGSNISDAMIWQETFGRDNRRISLFCSFAMS